MHDNIGDVALVGISIAEKQVISSYFTRLAPVAIFKFNFHYKVVCT